MAEQQHTSSIALHTSTIITRQQFHPTLLHTHTHAHTHTHTHIHVNNKAIPGGTDDHSAIDSSHFFATTLAPFFFLASHGAAVLV